MIVDAADETVTEERTLPARYPQVVLDVARCLFQVEGRNLVTDGDPLVERLVGRETEISGSDYLEQANLGRVRSAPPCPSPPSLRWGAPTSR